MMLSRASRFGSLGLQGGVHSLDLVCPNHGKIPRLCPLSGGTRRFRCPWTDAASNPNGDLDMEIDTKYAARHFFPNASFLQVYFEAVANAFDAGAENIWIEITTDGGIEPERLEISIRDDGVGFTDFRFEQFRRLQEPHDEFHKGLGRLVYLQYFELVLVDSVNEEGKRRKFEFSPDFSGDSTVEEVDESEERGTRLVFRKFAKARLSAYDDLKPSALKVKLLEQFLPLLHQKRVSGEHFRINISLETTEANPQYGFVDDEVALTPADIPDFEKRIIQRDDIDAFGEITMWFNVRESGSQSSIFTAVSIDRRTVHIPLLKQAALPPGYSATFIFESDLFSGRSDSARQRLDLPDHLPERRLHRVLREEVSAVLNERLPEIEEKNQKTRRHFEERYPHLTGLFEEESVGLIDRDDAIETAQWRFFRKQRELLDNRGVLDDERYAQSLELSSRSLAEYVLYRELIIERLRKVSASEKEEKIHNLIVPRYRTFDEGSMTNDIYSNNAWILDDKFMTFRTILSEARMADLIDAITLGEEELDADGRPDISMIFSADPDADDESAVDVVVVEVKKREVDDKEGPYAATQLVKRAEKLADHCPNIQRMWYFGIIEIDESLARLLRSMGWVPLFSKGHVFYKELDVEREMGSVVPTPTYLVSYDAVIEDAAARNHTFLELLKSDMRERAARSGLRASA